MTSKLELNASDDLIQELEQQLKQIEKTIADLSVRQFQSPDTYEARFKGYSWCVFCVEGWVSSVDHPNAIGDDLYAELFLLKDQIESSSPEAFSDFEIRDEEMLGVEVGFALCLDLIKMRSSGDDPSLTIETLLWDCVGADDYDHSLPSFNAHGLFMEKSSSGSIAPPAVSIETASGSISQRMVPQPDLPNHGDDSASQATTGLAIRAIAAAPFVLPLFLHISSFGGMLVRYWAWLVVFFAIGIYCSCREYRPVVGWAVPFVVLGIVFNPALPFYFDRSTWLILDVIFVVLLFVTPTRNSGIPTSIRIMPPAE